MVANSSMRRIHGWPRFGLSILFMAILLISYEVRTALSPSGSARDAMETDLAALGQPPRAVRSDYQAAHGIERASVRANYHGVLSYLEIRRYYDEATARQGWAYQEETSNPGSAGVTRQYCKEDYELLLTIADDRQAAGWTYALSL